MKNSVLQFPIKNTQTQIPPPSLRRTPTFESVDLESAKDMVKLIASLTDRAEKLLDFVDSQRETAKQAGIESIGIEVSVILEGDKIDQVLEALEEAVAKHRPAKITWEGLERVRRMEKLLTEASSNIQKYSVVTPPAMRPVLGQTSAIPGAAIWGPVVLFGVIIVGLVVYAVVSKSDGEGNGPSRYDS